MLIKTCIIFVYMHNDLNVQYFKTVGVQPEKYQYIFVHNDVTRLTSEIKRTADNIIEIERPNISQDIGAYGAAIKYLQVNELIDSFDYYVFLNSTVRGPFVPSYIQDWVEEFISPIRKSNVYLAGTSINLHEISPHVQSMAMCMRRELLHLCIAHNKFPLNDESIPKQKLITDTEIGISKLTLENGYNIDTHISCLRNMNWVQIYHDKVKFKTNVSDLCYNNGCFSRTLHPYEVIFIKTNRIQNNEILFLTEIHMKSQKRPMDIAQLDKYQLKYTPIENQHQYNKMLNKETDTNDTIIGLSVGISVIGIICILLLAKLLYRTKRLP
jgi:hypothetical protein